MQDSIASRLLYRTALDAIAVVARLLDRRGQLVLCLHSVAPANGGAFASSLSVTDRFLQDLIADVAGRGFSIVSLTEAVRRWQMDDDRPFLVLTFDDGYRDVFVNGFPVFNKYKVPFTVFVTTGLIDRTDPMWWHALEKSISRRRLFRVDEREIPIATRRQKRHLFKVLTDRFRAAGRGERRALIADLAHRNDASLMEDAYGSGLDWDMVRAMHASGHVEIGCHAVSHPVFARLDRTAIAREVAQSRARVIEATGSQPAHFAFPFGQDHEVGPHAPAIVQACGFSAAFTTNPTLMADHSRDAPFTLPRIVLSRKGGRVSAVHAYMSGIPQQIRAKLVS